METKNIEVRLWRSREAPSLGRVIRARGLLPIVALAAQAPTGVQAPTGAQAPTAAQGSTGAQAPVAVKGREELRRALEGAKPGAEIRLAGVVEGGIHFAKLRGEAGKPIVIAAADPKNPPIFRGGETGLHLSAVAHVELRDLAFEECASNGVSIDDGGEIAVPSHHVVLRRLRVARIGSKGNHDGIKLSGVDDFRVEGCVVDRWGSGGGSAIDMVGCHRGTIEGNTFQNTDGGTGVQAKGGSAEIVIRKNRFENAGARALNLGGSTGAPYFRPALGAPPHAEARNLTVEGNTIVGSEAAICFVGVDGAVARFNTIELPHKWAIRILQETTAEGFVPCRNGRFTDNVVEFRSDRWSEGGVNVGPGTEPKSFVFARNLWFCRDAPARSRPKLPVEESEGVYGVDPHGPESRRAGADKMPR